MANGVEARVTAVRPKDSIPLWDNSTPLMDTISVFVQRRDVQAVIDLYEAVGSGETEIDDDFDPGDPVPGV